MENSNKLALVAVLGSLLLSSPAIAANLVVAKWGVDSATCGNINSPCLTIQQAVNNSSVRGKIAVHPGLYTENIAISTEGLQLTSVAGRYATIIEADTTSTDVLSISSADKVVVGKKSKGFTFTGATTANGITISNSDRIKIEGNVSENNEKGFNLDTTDRIQVRNNIAYNNSDDGFSCDACPGALFQDNRSRDNGNIGFEFSNSDKVSFSRNIANNNSDDGVFFSSDSDFAKIIDNLISNNAAHGLYVSNVDGSVINANISIQNTDDGFHVVQSSFNKASQIRNNLTVANGSDGFQLTNITDTKFDGNSSIQNTDDGLNNNSTSFKTFKGNNTYASGSGVGLDTNSTINYSNHFFGRSTGPDGSIDSDRHDARDGSPLPTGTHNSKENKFKAKKAATL